MRIEKESSFILDTYAVIAFLLKEEGGKTVKRILEYIKEKSVKIYLNEINLGDVYYRIWKNEGESIGKEALNSCLSLPIKLITVDREIILHAAEIKAQNRVSYADAFCIATAKEKQAQILTGDPEFTSIEGIKVVWIGKEE